MKENIQILFFQSFLFIIMYISIQTKSVVAVVNCKKIFTKKTSFSQNFKKEKLKKLKNLIKKLCKSNENVTLRIFSL